MNISSIKNMCYTSNNGSISIVLLEDGPYADYSKSPGQMIDGSDAPSIVYYQDYKFDDENKKFEGRLKWDQAQSTGLIEMAEVYTFSQDLMKIINVEAIHLNEDADNKYVVIPNPGSFNLQMTIESIKHNTEAKLKKEIAIYQNTIGIMNKQN